MFCSRRLISLALCGLMAGVTLQGTQGAPSLSVVRLGTNGSGNREWEVSITPDAALFSNQIGGLGGSLAVELGFSVTGTTFVGATRNATAWPFENPGNNPFTGNVTLGIVPNGANLFAALGSQFFTSASPVQLMVLETLGSAPATLSWGGQTLLSGTANQYVGGRIAQGGQNFNNIQGSLSTSVLGDINEDGAVDALDAGILFSVWDTSNGLGDLNNDGIVDAADAGLMFENWTGDPAVPAAGTATAEYNAVTGELKLSSAGAINFFVESAAGLITPVSPSIGAPIGLLTNNKNRIGLTNLGPINLNNFSLPIGTGIPMSDLKLVYTRTFGEKEFTIAAGTEAFAYIPEPATGLAAGLGLVGLLRLRRSTRSQVA